MTDTHIEAKLTEKELLAETLDVLRTIQRQLEAWQSAVEEPPKVEVWRWDQGDRWYITLNGQIQQEGFTSVVEAMQAAADLRVELMR